MFCQKPLCLQDNCCIQASSNLIVDRWGLVLNCLWGCWAHKGAYWEPNWTEKLSAWVKRLLSVSLHRQPRQLSQLNQLKKEVWKGLFVTQVEKRGRWENPWRSLKSSKYSLRNWLQEYSCNGEKVHLEEGSHSSNFRKGKTVLILNSAKVFYFCFKCNMWKRDFSHWNL